MRVPVPRNLHPQQQTAHRRSKEFSKQPPRGHSVSRPHAPQVRICKSQCCGRRVFALNTGRGVLKTPPPPQKKSADSERPRH